MWQGVKDVAFCLLFVAAGLALILTDSPGANSQDKEGLVEVHFKFDVDDRVQTVLGDEGLIDSCLVDCAGNQYLVKLAGGETSWFREHTLEFTPNPDPTLGANEPDPS